MQSIVTYVEGLGKEKKHAYFLSQDLPHQALTRSILYILLILSEILVLER